VNAGDLRRVARRYLVDSSRTVLRVIPDDATKPRETAA
jgi:hypothetical protein